MKFGEKDFKTISSVPCFYISVIIHDIWGPGVLVSTNNAHNSLFLCELSVTPERIDKPLWVRKALLVQNGVCVMHLCQESLVKSWFLIVAGLSKWHSQQLQNIPHKIQSESSESAQRETCFWEYLHLFGSWEWAPGWKNN